MNTMEEKHLTIETIQDGKRVDFQEIHDPFMTHVTVMEFSIWDWLKKLFTGRRIDLTIKIQGDQEAVRQWFRTGGDS